MDEKINGFIRDNAHIIEYILMGSILLLVTSCLVFLCYTFMKGIYDCFKQKNYALSFFCFQGIVPVLFLLGTLILGFLACFC